MIKDNERGRALAAAAHLGGYPSVRQWADANGISSSAIYKVTRGVYVSDRINNIVDTYITDTIVAYARRLRRRRI